jgi:rubrerythrin
LFLGEKVIIPQSMRANTLKKIHKSHLGMDKCKNRARAVLYWPGLTKDIDKMISACSTCATFRRSAAAEPLIPHETRDIFTFKNMDYLLVVDYYSKYPEVTKLSGKTATSVNRNLREIFTRHGIPDELIADNMPFSSSTMQYFANDWGFTTTTTSPRYTKSNGQSERCIQTVKNLFKKTSEEDKDHYVALLDYRSTLLSGVPHSPAQLLMSRMLKTKLPVTKALLKPEVPP